MVSALVNALVACARPVALPARPATIARDCAQDCELAFHRCAEGTSGDRTLRYAQAPTVFQGYAADRWATQRRNACTSQLTGCYDRCHVSRTSSP